MMSLLHQALSRLPLLLLGLLLGATSMGCSTTDSGTPAGDPAAERGDPGPVRTDLEPLTRRFAALGVPRSATWQGGVLGDARAPGPSSYYIDAVVTLAPETTKQLATLVAPPPVDLPALPAAVASSAPGGPWLRSEALDRAFATESFSAQAYLAPTADVVVLRARGGN